LFSASTLKKAAEEIMAERNYVFRPAVLRPGDKLWGMNGITVRQFLRLLRKVPFTEKKWRCDPLISPLRRGW